MSDSQSNNYTGNKTELNRMFSHLFLRLPVLAAMFLVVGLGVCRSLSADVYGEIFKSPNDHREYRALKLPNDLRVLLIFDAKATKSAASLDINIGSGSDPENRAGLAHFLEHMLFLGTDKYPNAGEYQEFINTHGGSHNAYTSYAHTNYFFDIDASQFEPTLDRFAQFFTAPLFNAEYVKRERTVVHSEYSSLLKSDSRRSFAARKRAYNPEHPASYFAVGNLETLADRPGSDIRGELLAFYKKHYSANIMRLVVIGPQSIDELETLVREKFAKVPSHNAKPQFTDLPLYQANLLPAVLSIKPEKERRSLILNFPLPDTQRHYKSKPIHLISHLLGHEGKGSLLSWLKKQDWAENLQSGYGMRNDDQRSFKVSMSLTPSGFENRYKIVEKVFESIALIKETGVQSWVFDEQKRMLDLAYRFQGGSNPSVTVRTLSAAMHRYPVPEVISGGYTLTHFDQVLIKQYLGFLRPDNLLLIETAPDVVTTETEPYFKVPYSLTSLDAKQVSSWAKVKATDDLTLPEANPFLPENFAFLSTDADAKDKPILLQRPGVKFWYKNDLSFGAPRNNLYISIRSPAAWGSAKNSVLASLFADMVQEQLNEFSYSAALAGLGYEIYSHQRGISVRVTGYNDKQTLLLDRILTTIKSPQFDENTFKRLRADYIRTQKNKAKNDPSDQSVNEVYDLLLTEYWSKQVLIDAAQTVEFEAMQNYASRLLAKTEVVALAHGNIDKKTAAHHVALIEKLLADSESIEVNIAETVRVNGGERFSRKVATQHNDSAVAYYVQLGERDIDLRARSYLLSTIVESPFYHELRTVKQLGYSVYAEALPIDEVPGLVFSVQSPMAAPAFIVGEIEKFIADFAQQIDKIDEAEFAAVKQGLLNKVNRTDEKLEDRSSRYWREINRKQFDFNSRELISIAIKNASLKDVIALMQLTATGTGKGGEGNDEAAGRLIAYSIGSHAVSGGELTETQSGEIVRDALNFKQNREYFPLR